MSLKEIQKMDLNLDDRTVLDETLEVKRKTDKFWGM
jgi:hypothetical protein